MRDRRSVLLALPGADLYGSDRMAVETVRALVSADLSVTAAVPAFGPLVPLLTASGADVLATPTPVVRKGLLSARGLWELARSTLAAIGPNLRTLRRTRADTVIVNTITPPLWLLLARITGRYTICHVHEGEASISGVLRTALYIPLTLAHRIVVNSEFSLRVLTDAAPWLAGRCVVIYNAVAGPTHPTPPRRELADGVRLLYIGRLSERKGPHVALEAVRILRSRGVPCHLTVVGAVFPGNEAYEQRLREYVRAHALEEDVRFEGFLPDVWPALAASDVTLVPSTVDEPFGNTAVEASLAARASVVSSVGGLPEASSASAHSYLVPPGDAAAIADAVNSIVQQWSTISDLLPEDAKRASDRFGRARYERELRDAVIRRGR